jgi:hypothetical protein
MIAGLTATKVQMVSLSPAISVATVSTHGFRAALTGVWAALGPIGWAILGLSIAIPLLIQYWPEIVAAFQGFISFMQTTFGPTFSALWDSITAGAVSFWNGLITFTNGAVNSLLAGIEGLANGFIATVNGMIAAYNSVARLLGLGGISALAAITLPRINIPLVAAANGFDGMVNKPTMFLAGEAGPEHVTVTPSGRPGGGAGQIVIHNHIAGSMVTMDEVADHTMKSLKDKLRDAGFTGFQ